MKNGFRIMVVMTIVSLLHGSLQSQIVGMERAMDYHAEEYWELSKGIKETYVHDNKGRVISMGAEINGKQVLDDKYKYVYVSGGYIFAYQDFSLASLERGIIPTNSGIAADIYDADGKLIHSASEGYCDFRRYKIPDFTIWKKADMSWYDENGRFMYNERDIGSICVMPDGTFCVIKSNHSRSKWNTYKSIDLYNANKQYCCTVTKDYLFAVLTRFEPLGHFIRLHVDGHDANVEDKDYYYDMNLHEVPYKRYSKYGPLMSLTVDGTTHVFLCQQKDTVYLPHFNNKKIRDYAEYSSVGLMLVMMEDGSVYDIQGNYMYKSSGKLPNRLLDAGGGKYYSMTSSGEYGENRGISTLDGKEILAPEFDEVKALADNIFAFKLSGYWGVLRRTGNANKVIIPLERAYTKIEYSRTLKKFTFEKKGAKGTCNANGVQTSITKVAPPPAQTPSRPANNNQPQQQQQQQQPSRGNQPDVKTPVYMPCPTCGGTLHCPTCAGTGSYWSGSDKRRCGVCNGTGVCQSCHGTGTSAVIYY